MKTDKYIIYFDYGRNLVFYLPNNALSGFGGVKWSKHGNIEKRIFDLKAKLLMCTGIDVEIRNYEDIMYQSHINMCHTMYNSFKDYINRNKQQ